MSPDALDVARRNVDDYGLAERLELHQSNLFDALPARRYDVILCNPPYVNSGSMDALPQEYLHEPQLALAGGADGMDLVRRILEAAPRYLSDEGVLVLEIGHERDFFEAAFPELSPVWLDTEEASDQLLLLTREQLKSDTRPRIDRAPRHQGARWTAPSLLYTPANAWASSARTAPASRRCSRS